jgi:excisionase family DNA binding protein
VRPALTTSEAARRLGISKSTLLRAVRRGLVRAAFRTPGQHLRFTTEDLDAFRAELRSTHEEVA